MKLSNYKTEVSSGGMNMKIKCWICGNVFVGTIYKDNLGCYSYCPICNSSFDIDEEDAVDQNEVKEVILDETN
jgi:hypothetical protein